MSALSLLSTEFSEILKSCSSSRLASTYFFNGSMLPIISYSSAVSTNFY